jgi:hypothetical protein
MPKVTLTFDLPDDTEHYTQCMDGPALRSAVDEFRNYLRSLVKYQSESYSKEQLKVIEEIREELYNCIGEFIN